MCCLQAEAKAMAAVRSAERNLAEARQRVERLTKGGSLLLGSSLIHWRRVIFRAIIVENDSRQSSVLFRRAGANQPVRGTGGAR